MRECHPDGVQGRRPIDHKKVQKKQVRNAKLQKALLSDFKK
ncbi:hypothetical protein [Acetilactobacillus jinshanensis]|nr:hypothetical protein [Acetilactobacillus jinshanensis]